MKERPIIFSAEMVRAILAGSKTQTRRAIEPQPEVVSATHESHGLASVFSWQGRAYPDDDFVYECSPYGGSGDNLWVRETWAIEGQYRDGPGYCYRADGDKAGVRWKSPRYMPRVGSRITLEVTSVRAERVQDISEDDAIAEGISSVYTVLADMTHDAMSPVDEFRKLWDSINAKRGYGWDFDPWVWVVEFKKLA